MNEVLLVRRGILLPWSWDTCLFVEALARDPHTCSSSPRTLSLATFPPKRVSVHCRNFRLCFLHKKSLSDLHFVTLRIVLVGKVRKVARTTEEQRTTLLLLTCLMLMDRKRVYPAQQTPRDKFSLSLSLSLSLFLSRSSFASLAWFELLPFRVLSSETRVYTAPRVELAQPFFAAPATGTKIYVSH